MIKVEETVSLAASADDVWALIGRFDGAHRWHPAIASSTTSQDGGVPIRELTLGDGSKIVERLDARHETEHSYTYTIINAGPLPVKNYQATISVKATGAHALVSWCSEFIACGAPDADAQAAIAGIYTAGFAALVEKFGAA